MAHRLARLVYRMLKYGQHYVDKGAEYYEQRNRQQQIDFLKKKAAQLGLQVTPATCGCAYRKLHSAFNQRNATLLHPDRLVSAPPVSAFECR